MATRRRRRRYRFKKRFFVITGVLLLAIVASLVLLLRSCGSEEGGGEKTEKPKTTKGATLGASGTADDAYMDSILYIGDSRTHGFSAYGYIPAGRVLAEDALDHKSARTKAFLRLDGVVGQVTIAEAVAQLKPRIMLVAFGINGFSTFTEDEFFREFEGLLDDLRTASPDSAIIVQSILPVTAKYEVDFPKYNNDKIDEYNKKLEKVCVNNGYYFLNPAPDLKSTDKKDAGALAKQFAEPDGMHFNSKAYETLLLYIREHPAPVETN